MLSQTEPQRDEPASVRAEEAAWQRRLGKDSQLADLHQTDALKAVTADLLTRARVRGSLSVALTGSTALNRRTRDSDLDFYVVGERPVLPFREEEVDVYAVSLEDFKQRLYRGDDYLHWTLRFGLILHDTGPFRWALRATARERLWPDPNAKAIQARQNLELARSILLTGDHDAALEQCRNAFSLVGRWWLLKSGVFPRARVDLPDQLAGTPFRWLGEVLASTILAEPSESELMDAAERAQAIMDREVHVRARTPALR